MTVKVSKRSSPGDSDGKASICPKWGPHAPSRRPTRELKGSAPHEILQIVTTERDEAHLALTETRGELQVLQAVARPVPKAPHRAVAKKRAPRISPTHRPHPGSCKRQR